MRIVALSALLLFLVDFPALSQEEGRPISAAAKGAVYAKIVLPVMAPAGGDHPPVESWIARKLRKGAGTDLRAVTGWVRLAEMGEDSTALWDATLDGEPHGCPVHGQVSQRTTDGRVLVTLSGWAPFAPKIKGNSLPDEIGSRTIAVVDTGRADGARSYVALMIAPALQRKAESGPAKE